MATAVTAPIVIIGAIVFRTTRRETTLKDAPCLDDAVDESILDEILKKKAIING